MSDFATPPPDLNEQLLRQVLAQEPEAQDLWYRTEFPRVYRLCLGFLADPVAAEDLAQDAMIHLLDRLDRRQPGRPYPAWRTRVVLNLCRDRLRRRKARQQAEDRLRRVPIPAALPDPQDAAAQRDSVRAVVAALVDLPEREREAFVLHHLEHHSTAEVAAVMEIGASSVRSLLTLARRRLRRLLAPALRAESGTHQGGGRG